MTVTQTNVTGTGFSVTGLTLPLTLSPGQSFTFGAVYTPISGGNASSNIAVVVTGEPPELVRVSEGVWLLPTCTLPKLRVGAATLSDPRSGPSCGGKRNG